MKKRKRSLAVLLLTIMCFVQLSYAEGLFPTANDIFGDYVVSVAAILGRDADSDTATETERTLVFNGFTTADYEKLSAGLAADGCTLVSSEPDAACASFTVESSGNTIEFAYQYPDETLTVIYPANVRLKEEAAAATGKGILPDVAHMAGEDVPSAASIPGVSVQVMEIDGYDTELCRNITDSGYHQYGSVLGNDGWTVTGAEASDGIMSVSLIKGNAGIQVNYSSASSELWVMNICMAYVGDKCDVSGGESILPDLDEMLGVSLPSAADAIRRSPDSEVTGDDGEIIQTYNSFSDEDYDTFSAYLAGTACGVDGYSLDGSVLTVHLSLEDHGFDFEYDHEKDQATLIYPAGSRPERSAYSIKKDPVFPVATATPMPTATPRPTVKPTPRPTVKPTVRVTAIPENYTADECYAKAIAYLKKRLKNPTSLIVNEYSCTKESDGKYAGCYFFMIDYSAQNGFGGYNRSSYFCYVSYVTGEVKFGYGT